MRRGVLFALFAVASGCSLGDVAQPGDPAPVAQAPAELATRCDELGAPWISAAKIKACLDEGTSQARCMEPAFGEYLKTHTTKEALSLLQCFEDTDVEIRDTCHPVSHAIGRQTFVVHGTIDRSFAACDQTCISGCYHGVMERFLRGDADPQGHISLAELQAKSATACDATLSHADRGQCWHGLGHAILFYTGYALKASLSVCDAIAESGGKGACYGGVFMENVVAADTAERDLSATDFHYPCDVVDDRYKTSCYLMQTSRMFEMGLTADQVLVECRNAGAWRVSCIQSLGRDIAYHAVANDPRATAEICELAVGEDRVACLTGVVTTLESFDWDGRYALPYCPSYSTHEDVAACYTFATQLLGGTYAMTPAQVEAQCLRYAMNTECLAAAAAYGAAVADAAKPKHGAVAATR